MERVYPDFSQTSRREMKNHGKVPSAKRNPGQVRLLPSLIEGDWVLPFGESSPLVEEKRTEEIFTGRPLRTRVRRDIPKGWEKKGELS